jgi:Fe-coproporphyrin III synthase
MTTLTNIVTSIDPTVLPESATTQRIGHLPILVLFPHNRCNCRCVMCDIWKIRESQQLYSCDLEAQMESIRALGVKWLVLSGGEPLLHEGLGEILLLFRAENIRITLLSTGLLLQSCASLVARHVDEVIVSLDGPQATHNAIRRIPNAFEQLQQGVRSVREINPNFPIHARCTLQKANHTELADTVETARRLGLNSISFLAADTTSAAFNRPEGWNSARKSTIQLNITEINTLSASIDWLEKQHPEDFVSRFIQESPDKLRRIVNHFRSQLGYIEASAPLCNAPWVSAVVEADGMVRPCFFHPPIGNLKDGPLLKILNSERALRFRAELDVETNPTCRNCVCALNYTEPPKS